MARRVFLAVALAGLAVRLWQLHGRHPVWWEDSRDYIAMSRASLLSLDFWAGKRPAVVPLLIKLVGRNGTRVMYAQATVAALGWAAVAASVVSVLEVGRRRWVAVGAIAALSVTFPVVMWDQSLLSESLALSTLALLLGAGIQVAREATGWRVVGFVAALALWLTTRDSHAAVVLVAALGLGLWLLLRRAPVERVLGALAISTVVIAMLASGAAAHGQRYAFPLRNVFAVRVLPYPDRVAWFAARGMPQAEAFAPRPPAEPGRPPIRYVYEKDPAFKEWLAWLERDGRRAFLGWMVTHPGYVAFEPWRNPERAFNNAEGHRSYYAPPDLRTIPLATGLMVPPRVVALLLAVGASAWAVRQRRWRSPVFLVGAIAVVLAAPHGLVSWHSDGMETARHLVVPVVQLHVGVVLTLIGALTDVSEPPTETSG